VWYAENRDAPAGRSDALVRSALDRKEQISEGGTCSSDSSLSSWCHCLAGQYGAMTVASASNWRNVWTKSGRSIQGGLQQFVSAVQRLSGRCQDGGSPRLWRLGLASGNWQLRVALRGEPVDGVGGPQGLHVSKDAGVELPIVHGCFAAESVGCRPNHWPRIEYSARVC
jgi:hypothetical protein